MRMLHVCMMMMISVCIYAANAQKNNKHQIHHQVKHVHKVEEAEEPIPPIHEETEVVGEVPDWFSNLDTRDIDFDDTTTLDAVGRFLLAEIDETGYFTVEARTEWAETFSGIVQNKNQAYGFRAPLFENREDVMKKLEEKVRAAGEKNYDSHYTTFFARQLKDCINEKAAIVYLVAEDQPVAEKEGEVPIARTYFVGVCGGSELVVVWVTGQATGTLAPTNQKDQFDREDYVEKWLTRGFWKTISNSCS